MFLVLHDTDLHGFSCGVAALYSLWVRGFDVDVYAEYAPGGAGTCPPSSLPSLVRRLAFRGGFKHVIVLDVPVDSGDPLRFVSALAFLVSRGACVEWLDHHEGQELFVLWLEGVGVRARLVCSSYELVLAKPLELGVDDSFVREWAVLGALADFDYSVAGVVSRGLERDVVMVLDPVYKLRRRELAWELGLDIGRDVGARGEAGALAYMVARERVSPWRFLEAARRVGVELPAPSSYRVEDGVVYTLEEPPPGMAWKWAWLLCYEARAKIALLRVLSPRTGKYHVIVAKYWRCPEAAKVVEEIVKRLADGGYRVTGHPGARSIEVGGREEAEQLLLKLVPLLAEKLRSEA